MLGGSKETATEWRKFGSNAVVTFKTSEQPPLVLLNVRRYLQSTPAGATRCWGSHRPRGSSIPASFVCLDSNRFASGYCRCSGLDRVVDQRTSVVSEFGNEGCVVVRAVGPH